MANESLDEEFEPGGPNSIAIRDENHRLPSSLLSSIWASSVGGFPSLVSLSPPPFRAMRAFWRLEMRERVR
ncbi:uncharacterized protein A4U43_C08F1290 [Asparagus officinalis]|nr:uncharacterized protein A4U43_C08F1290 [Asparagus officinalis]